MKTIHKHMIILACLIAAIITCTFIFSNYEIKASTEVATIETEKPERQVVYSDKAPSTFPEPIVIFAPTNDGEIDWKTCIITEEIDILNDLFAEYESPVTMYTTTGVHMRKYPNTDSESIQVLYRNTEVTTIADYNGWTRVETEDGNQYYIWNQYLSEEKQKDRYLGKFKITAYCSCSSCCGQWSGGPTASGTYPVTGRTIAMGGVPFGTKLMINGHIYIVEDRGTPYGHVDIYFDSHEKACDFGLKYANVYRVE